jgi:thiamine biosynthesis lipoprotein
MKTVSLLLLLLGSLTMIGSSSLGSTSTAPRDRLYRFNYENVLGTSLELKILAGSESGAETAQTAAVNEIERQAKILSGYDASSEFSRWMKTSGQPVPVSPELVEVLGLFDQWRDRTGGALDASAETITRVWKHAAAQKRMPTSAELAEAVELVKQPHWSVNAAEGIATHLSNAPLVLNSLAKSYIVNKAADAVMNSAEVRGAVVNIGGDLVVRGNLTEPVDIADPFSDAENSTPIASLTIHNRAVATSGNYRRGVEIDGRHYSHIVDPRNGQPADSIVSATVIADSPADAGALATAFSVMQPDESRGLAASMRHVEFLLVKNNGARVTSPGWKALTTPAAPLLAASADSSWDPSMELTISVELARIDDYRVRRPYLAAWIEDRDRFPVRTVALWFQKPRYLPELKAWFKDDRMRSMAEGSDITRSVSSATRPAGKYTLKWDGKDNAGKPVKPGKYTVMIEAAREHGSYQLIHQEMDFTGTPKQIQLPGGPEIASASLDYRKASH